MRRISTTTGNSGAETSPGTPEHEDNNYGEGISKGWSSERVPLAPANNSIRRQISAAALMPFNSGRAPPSKWDDAERWITSPVSGAGASKNTALQSQKKPKSKSGPLGPPGVMCMANYSPNVAVLGSGNGKDFVPGLPFTTGVLVPDAVSVRYAIGDGVISKENPIAKSTNLSGSSHLISETSIPNSQDDGNKEAESAVSRVVSRRDMATQISPESSTRSSFSIPPSGENAGEQHSNCSSMVEVRDVPVDKGATINRLSRKHCLRKTRKNSSEATDLARPWGVGGSTKQTSNLEREAAKITAWENLEKAKAEAAIHKLEARLETKRSASMDKILKKLRAAQMKAQAMRGSMTEDGVHQSSRISPKTFLCKYIKISCVFSCFFKRT